MYSFQEQVRNVLLESGWSPGRRIDISDYKNFTLREGYTWSNSVQEFVEEFGRLKISFFRNAKKDFLHFDLKKAIDDIDSTWINEDYSNRIGTTDLCVVGQAYSDHMTLIMSKDGKMYGGFDDSLYSIGNNGYEGIENIILNRPLIPI